VDPLIEKTRKLIQSILQKPSQVDSASVGKLINEIKSTSEYLSGWQFAFISCQSETEKDGLYADKANTLEDLVSQLSEFCPKEDVQASTSLSNDDFSDAQMGDDLFASRIG
jgi:hypothetical protein